MSGFTDTKRNIATDGSFSNVVRYTKEWAAEGSDYQVGVGYISAWIRGEIPTKRNPGFKKANYKATARVNRVEQEQWMMKIFSIPSLRQDLKELQIQNLKNGLKTEIIFNVVRKRKLDYKNLVVACDEFILDALQRAGVLANDTHGNLVLSFSAGDRCKDTFNREPYVYMRWQPSKERCSKVTAKRFLAAQETPKRKRLMRSY